MKNFKKIWALLFLSAYLLIGVSFGSPALAIEVTPVQFTPQIGIPGSEFKETQGVSVGSVSDRKVTSDLLARYVKAFYQWGLSIVGVIAVLILMAGGIIWLTSGGDSGKINDAKKMIEGALLGTFLLLGAYFFLNTINPNLTKLPVIEVDNLKNTAIQETAPYNEDTEDGFIDNVKNLPEDTLVKWVCMNSTDQQCLDTNPPSMNLDTKICSKKLGSHGPCGYGLIWCCGKSDTLQKEIDNFCEGKETGTSCKKVPTDSDGSGYCENNKCVPCKEIGSSCSGKLKNYECPGETHYCGGRDSTSDCNCNVFGANCTCDETWK